MEESNKEDIPNENIRRMIIARESLETSKKMDTEYKKIYDLIQEYINIYCSHEIIEDYIDIFPEKSQKIKYCQKCFTNF
jgi:hypothetical protein